MNTTQTLLALQGYVLKSKQGGGGGVRTPNADPHTLWNLVSSLTCTEQHGGTSAGYGEMTRAAKTNSPRGHLSERLEQPFAHRAHPRGYLSERDLHSDQDLRTPEPCSQMLLYFLSQLNAQVKELQNGETTENRQPHKNAAVHTDSCTAETLDSMESGNITNGMQMNRLSISKYKSILSHHFCLSDLNSV